MRRTNEGKMTSGTVPGFPVILAIDTSTDRITVAICRGKEILVNESHLAEKHHSRRLLRLIDDCLTKANVKLQDMDAFATTIGPGSFTGVRTALGTIKGLAFTTSRPVISIPTLLAMAYPSREFNQVAPVLEARRGFVYTAIFERQQEMWQETLPPTMMSIEEFSKKLTPSTTVIGNAIQKYVKENPEMFSRLLNIGNSKFDFICGTTLCEISHQKFVNKEFEDVFSLEPLYIQKTAAEGYV